MRATNGATKNNIVITDSTPVDNRPFKALVTGSSPTQPNFYFPFLIGPGKQLIKPIGRRPTLVNDDTAMPLFG